MSKGEHMSQIIIAEGGNPYTTITLASDVAQPAMDAANDMVRVMEKMSDAKLPVVMCMA